MRVIIMFMTNSLLTNQKAFHFAGAYETQKMHLSAYPPDNGICATRMYSSQTGVEVRAENFGPSAKSSVIPIKI